MKKMDLFGSQPPKDTAPVGVSRRDLLARLASKLNSSTFIPGDQLVFKGGLFLGEHTGVPRYTQDVDASVLSCDVYLRAREVLKEFGEELIAEDIIHEYEVLEDVVEKRSGGAKYIDVKGRVLLSIDISLHGAHPLDSFVMDTELVGPIRLTTVEQILCDKLSVLFSRSRFRRAKDLYDTWLILENCNPDVNKIAELLQQREVFPLPVEKAPFRDDCIKEMEHAYERFKLKDPVTEEELEKPPYAEIVSRVGGFLVKFMRDDT